MRTLLRRYRWVIIALVVAGAPVAWYLGSPLFINRVVDEPFPTSTGAPPFPMSAGATIPEGMTQQQVEDRMMEASRVQTPADEAMPSGAAGTVAARGTFAGADEFHKGEGTATVYRVGQDLILRFEAFKVTNGPDLHVILAKHAAPRSRADVTAGYLELGKLKGNIGNQNYSLPREVSLAEYRTVVIYCKPFHVVFAAAPLKVAE
jgi:hypothetical protein